MGCDVKGPRRTMGWGTHKNLKDRRLYLSLYSDLWDERMADFLSNCRRVHSLGLLRNNKLLARLSSFPPFSLMDSLSTLNTSFNLSSLNSFLLDLCWRPKFHKKAHSMKSKEGPIHAARRINIKALCMFRFLAKRPLKNLEKSSVRTRPGYLEAARCSRFSGRVAQLRWDWDSSKGVPWNTRNEE